MVNKPTVTVIVPIYKVEQYLRRCVESLLAQDYPSLEIILVDDGSPDRSATICDEYASIYSNIKAIHKVNGGLSSARKAGYDAATGQLIAFVDSDDYVSPQYISLLAEPFADEDIQLSMCGYATQTDSNIIPAALPYKEPVIENKDIAASYMLPLIGASDENDAINIPGFVWIRMYRKELLKADDFVSEREYFTEDIIMNLLYARRLHGKIAVVNKALYFYCVNPGSLTLSYRENAFEKLVACNGLCRQLISDLSIEAELCQRRLDANLSSAVTYGIYNAGKIKQYRQFKNELHKIYDTVAVKKLMRSGHWPMSATWHRIIYYCHKYRLNFILFCLLKTRKVL